MGLHRRIGKQLRESEYHHLTHIIVIGGIGEIEEEVALHGAGAGVGSSYIQTACERITACGYIELERLAVVARIVRVVGSHTHYPYRGKEGEARSVLLIAHPVNAEHTDSVGLMADIVDELLIGRGGTQIALGLLAGT